VAPDRPIATDEECAFALGEARGNTYIAAALLAETKAMEFLYRPSTVRKGDRMTSYADMATHFLTLAKQLRNNASMATTTLYAGGLSESEHQSAMQDADLRQPAYTKHKHEQRHTLLDRDDEWY
jgi:hypothetical protein